MDITSRDALLTAMTVVLTLVGIALVLMEGQTLTLVGMVLIAASWIVFLVDAKDLLVKTDENARE